MIIIDYFDGIFHYKWANTKKSDLYKKLSACNLPPLSHLIPLLIFLYYIQESGCNRTLTAPFKMILAHSLINDILAILMFFFVFLDLKYLFYIIIWFRLSVCMYVCMSVCLYVCLSVCMSVCCSLIARKLMDRFSKFKRQ